VESVQVTISGDAADFVQRRGGRLWVWAAYGKLCCAGSPPWMHAATEPPPGLSGFSPVSTAGLDVWFRIPSGQLPDVLEIGLRGKRHPRVEAYWDGCSFAL